MMLDAVAVYDRISPSFAGVLEEGRAYLDAVERPIVSAIPAGRSPGYRRGDQRGETRLAPLPPAAGPPLDMGAGDGARALRIAQAAGMTPIVLLEPGEKIPKIGRRP